MHRTKPNPMPEHSSAQQLANDFNNFFKNKVAKIQENFDDGTENAFEYDSETPPPMSVP